MRRITPTFTVTERGTAKLNRELLSLQQQAEALLGAAHDSLGQNERQDALFAPSILQQERLYGRLIELNWLLHHVRPAHTINTERSVHHA